MLAMASSALPFEMSESCGPRWHGCDSWQGCMCFTAAPIPVLQVCRERAHLRGGAAHPGRVGTGR